MTNYMLTIDANDPERMARFWASLLGYELTPPPEGHATWRAFYVSLGEPEDSFAEGSDGTDRIRDPAGVGPQIWFQIVPETKDPQAKNRLHLDVRVSAEGVPYAERKAAVTARVEEVVAAGATVLRTSDAFGGEGQYFFATLRDPEGNEFCLA